MPQDLPVPADLQEWMVGLRRDFHRHPELSWQETRTAAAVARELDRLGIPHRTGIGGTGVVADLPGDREGPAVALRVDMDALPIQEQTRREGFPAHPSRFDFDEDALAFGAAWFTEIALRAGERISTAG